MRDGILRKISGGKLRGGMGVGWSALEVYQGLESPAWFVGIGILAVEGWLHFLSWLF